MKSKQFRRGGGAVGGMDRVVLEDGLRSAISDQVARVKSLGKRDVYKDREMSVPSRPQLKGNQGRGGV
jgi:hypothetical protein